MGEKQKPIHKVIVVIDTNIIFSAILSPSGTISDLLLNSSYTFDFYAPTAILEELDTHHQKLLKLSGFSDDELSFLKRTILKKVEPIDMESIRKLTWEKAVKLTYNVDEFDAPFIALCLELDSPLWTGDKKLSNGLKKKGIDWVLDTEIIKKLRGGSIPF